jgi:hypothetical protein
MDRSLAPLGENGTTAERPGDVSPHDMCSSLAAQGQKFSLPSQQVSVISRDGQPGSAGRAPGYPQ